MIPQKDRASSNIEQGARKRELKKKKFTTEGAGQ